MSLNMLLLELVQNEHIILGAFRTLCMSVLAFNP